MLPAHQPVKQAFCKVIVGKINTTLLHLIKNTYLHPMYSPGHATTKQLIALLLMLVMLLVHAVKLSHNHTPAVASKATPHDSFIAKTTLQHSHCSICDFHLTRDTILDTDIPFLIAPVYASPTYTRLLTSIIAHRLHVIEGRGPPHA